MIYKDTLKIIWRGETEVGHTITATVMSDDTSSDLKEAQEYVDAVTERLYDQFVNKVGNRCVIPVYP